MTRRYGLLLAVLLLVPVAFAQQVDTVIARRLPGPPLRSVPPGAEMDEKIIIQPDDRVVYFIRRHGAEGDSAHAFIRRLPEIRQFRLHADSVRLRVDSVLRGRDFRLYTDSLTRREHLFKADSTWRLFGRFEADSPARFRIWTDSARAGARHLFRLHADSLRLGDRMWFERRRPGARVEFVWPDDVEVIEGGDSTTIRLRRLPGEAPRRTVIPRGERQRPETRPDGVLVVPDGRGGTWIYLPPEEE